MEWIINAAVLVVALLHIGFGVLEMVLWEKPIGLKVFGQRKEQAAVTKILAANQGLYNLFIAAGLIWGLYLGVAGDHIKMFFLICVIVAGVFGAFTASKAILVVQAIPGAVALALLLGAGLA